MQVRRKPQVRRIEHPNDPSFAVFVRKLQKIDGLEYQDLLQRYQTKEPIRDPETKELLRNAAGDPFVHVMQRFPKDAILETFEKYITGWEGLKDEDGKDVPFAASELYLLFDDGLDVREDDSVTPFWQYLNKKAFDVRTFDSDPLASA